jgi:hypothetical protein
MPRLLLPSWLQNINLISYQAAWSHAISLPSLTTTSAENAAVFSLLLEQVAKTLDATAPLLCQALLNLRGETDRLEQRCRKTAELEQRRQRAAPAAGGSAYGSFNSMQGTGSGLSAKGQDSLHQLEDCTCMEHRW